ncbi:hypothetical protein [Streptomyces sp. NPDC058247]|uniref:hypothetical protein n=1 Tax=Streptomyces sp. NPDC058247 TaxID=3346401 RepID=UPI0036E17166
MTWSLGALGIGAAIWVILANFMTLIGGSAGTATWLALSVPAVLVLSAVAARVVGARSAATA